MRFVLAFCRLLPYSIRAKFFNYIEYMKNLSIFQQGYKYFLKKTETPHEAYLSLINLFCMTSGAFNENFHEKRIETNSIIEPSDRSSLLLGNFTTKDFKQINQVLNNDGYYLFDKKLDHDIVSRLSEFAKSIPAITPYSKIELPSVNLEHPTSEIYRLNKDYIVCNEDVQRLIMDPILIEVARNYLKVEPIFDYPAMWWNTAFLDTPSSEAAQLYHFDMERIKWLKIFIYLTDVDDQKGPHCYIEGTHKVGAKPIELMKKGYARIEDHEIQPYYEEKKFKKILAPAGSFFAGDTKCWHKGTNVLSGYRLVLELNYTSSLFGANHPLLNVKHSTKEFKEFCQENRSYTRRLTF